MNILDPNKMNSKDITINDWRKLLEVYSKGLVTDNYMLSKIPNVVWDSVSIRNAQKEEEYHMDEYLGGGHE